MTKPQGSAPGRGYSSLGSDRSIAQKYASCFIAGNPDASRPISIAMEVSNDLLALAPDHIADLGTAWGTEVRAFGSYLRSHHNAYFGRVTPMAGMDRELGYSSESAYFAWITAYHAATSTLLVDNGSLESCPPDLRAARNSCSVKNDANGTYLWTQDQLASLFNVPWIFPVPQIYKLSEARQWQQLSLYSAKHGKPAITFESPLSQGDTAKDGSYTASQAWTAFFHQLNTGPGHAATSQNIMPFNTYIAPGI